MTAWPEKYPAVVVSTAHLPQDLAEYMDAEERCSSEDPYPYLTFEKLTYGYRVWTHAEHLPDAIRPLIHAAKDDGFRWVDFDCDGPGVEGFQTWEW